MDILVIEDAVKSAKLEKKVLEKSGNNVFLAYNGKEGAEKAKSKLPDLILLDIKLPDVSGYKVCKHLKKHRKTKNIPIFMVTSNGKMEDIEKAFRLGADDYITKPFRAGTLWRLIKKKLEKLN